MDDRNKKIFIYVSFLIPLIILFSEISLAIFTNIAGIKLPNKQKVYKVKHPKTFDLITGTNRYKTPKLISANTEYLSKGKIA